MFKVARVRGGILLKVKIETAVVVLVMVLVAFVGLSAPTAASATPVETSTTEPEVLAPTVNGISLQGAVQDLGDQQYRIGWFADNFNDNVKDAQWVQEGGTWTLSGGTSQLGTNTRIRTTSGQWDTNVSAKVTITAAGSGTNSGRILFRWNDASNYHYLDLYQRTGTLSLHKVIAGKDTQLWSAKPSGGIVIGTAYQVKVSAKAGAFVVSWKGAILGQPIDPSSPAPSGMAAIGFATVGSSARTTIDDVRAWTATLGSVFTGADQTNGYIRTVHSLTAFNGVDILVQSSPDNMTWGDWHYVKANARSTTDDADSYALQESDRLRYARFRIDLRTTDDSSPALSEIEPYAVGLPDINMPGGGMGSEPSQYYVGGIVNAMSRNLFLQEADLALPGKGWNIQFARSYNSMSTISGPLGVGWTHSYNIFLAQGTGVVNFTDGDGSIHTFVDMGNGLYSPPRGLVGVKLVRNVDNTYTMSWKDGTRWAFSTVGRITQMADRNGNKLTFTYDASSRLIGVADDTGIYITLGYDPNGHIVRVSDFNGTVSTKSPTAQGGAWASGQNALSSDNLYAGTKSSSALHDFYNYHITSQGTSSVAKVEACVEAYSLGDDRIGVKISTNAGSSWSPEQVVTLPGSDPNAIACRDFTSFKSAWAWADLSDANFRVQARYVKVGGQASYVYLDWIPVRVTTTGRTVTYGYDASGRLSSVTDPLQASSLYMYTADNLLEKYVDRANKVLRFVFDTVSGRGLSIYAGRYDRSSGSVLWQYRMYDIMKWTSRLRYTTVWDALNGYYVYTTIGYDLLLGVPTWIEGPLAALGGIPGCGCGGGCSGGSSSGATYWEMAWDGENQCVRKEDARGHAIITSYDWMGNAIRSTDALGNYTESIWQNRDGASAFDSLVLAQRNKRGYWSQNEYDTKGNLVKAFDALGNYTQNFFDSTGLLTQSRDKRGFSTFYGYDSHGWQTTVTDPLSHVTRTDYDTVGRRVKTTTALGIVGSSTFNGNDWVTSERNDLGFTTNYEYNGRGDRIAIVDANGNRTTIEVNVTCPQATKTIDPTGAVTEKICDRLGRLVQVNDPNGKSWKYEYDQYGRKTREIDPNGFATRFTYDAAGNLVTRVDADGRQLDNTYDALNRVTQTQENKTAMDNMEVAGLWSYTEVGGSSFLLGADGGYSTAQSSSPTHSVYVQFSGGYADGTDWGLLVLGKWYDSTRIDTLSVAFYIDWFQHNGDYWDKMDSGVRMRLYDSAGTNFANYTYWLASWYLGQDYKDVPTDGYTVRIYNGRPPMNAWTTFSRDPNQDWTIDWARAANVRIELYVAATGTFGTPTNQFRIYFDDLAVGHKADLLTYQYDAVGNGVQETGYGYTRTRTYDALDRISSMTFDFGSFQETVQYAYDENGNRKTMVYPDGFTVTYTWNGDGLLTGMQAPGQIWAFRYDADHRRTAAVHPNGLELNYTYDDANRLSAARTKKTSDGSLVDGNSYTYDKMANRKTKTHENDNEQMSFDYEDNYMLEDTTYSDGTTASYVYDSNGNRIYRNYSTESQMYWYDESSNLTRRDVFLAGTLRISDLYAYDNAGNRIRWTNTIIHRGTTSYDFAYDVEGRLTGVSVDGFEVTSYGYFVDGARIRKTEIGTPSYFLYDFKDFSGYEDILEQYDATGAVIARFIQGPGIDEPLAMQYGGSWYYYHFDGLGSVTMLTRADQTVANRYEYDDFGGFLTRQESVPNFYGYTGREYDSQVDLIYMRARYYDPSIGRFLTRDPAGMSEGPNLYTYAGNNPLSCADPSGEHCCSWWEFFIFPGFWWCRTHHTDWGCAFNCILTVSGNRQWLVYWCMFAAGVACKAGIGNRACFIFIGACVGIQIGMCIDKCTPRGCWYAQ